MPQTDTLDLPAGAGLAAPASITVDRWGIPHLKAASFRDLMWLQGFNAARDRLWQIDLWRKRGLGLLAADFGPGYLAQDKASRMFLYRGDMAAEWAAYAPDAREICEAFVAGINAYVAQAEADAALMPPEFGVAGTRPSRWAAEDVVRIRSHGLTRNALSEVARSLVMAKADAATDALRKLIEPAKDAVIPPGVPLGLAPMVALEPFRLAMAGVTFSPERLAAGLDQAGAWSKCDDLGDVIRDPDFEGSNNWAIHGSRTVSGRPLLASDPHRTHALPSLRYIVHLTCPGFDAIGAGEPCVPGISLGHNGTIAFGLTIFGGDQEDVYLYETDPADPRAYRHKGGWARMEQVTEAVPVKGHADQPCVMAFTRHGPVLWRSADDRHALAVRSVWFEPGSAPYLASLSGMRAQDLAGFRAAASRWGAPSVNLVYADQGGTIAWLPAGYSPVRPNWDGLLPVPGDGSHEWAGMRPASEMPEQVNPPEGFVYSANEMNLPSDWPHDAKPIGFEWIENSRASRIREVLREANPASTETCSGLQTDVGSMPARRLAKLVAALSRDDPDLALARDLFAGWDARLLPESPAAALFEVWWAKELRAALFTALCPDPEIRKLLPPGDPAGILQALEEPDRRFGANPTAGRDALLVRSLTAAVQRCRDLMGGDPGKWAWGRLHKAGFDHALAGLGGAASGWRTARYPIGGSASTPMHTGYHPSDFRVTHGASFRMVVDFADLDAARCINAPGQSGRPDSPHFADLMPVWAVGGYVPMSYSAAAIARHAETVILLNPGA